MGRIGGDKHGIGEAVAPELAERDQVATVRAIAVEKDDEAFRGARRSGQHGAGELYGFGH